MMSRFIMSVCVGVLMLLGTARSAPLPDRPLPGLEVKKVVSIDADYGDIRTASFSPDGKRVLASSDRDYGPHGNIGVWDVETGKKLLEIDTKHYLYTVAFSHEGKRIASGGYDGLLKIWDAQSGALLKSLKGHSAQLASVAFSPDGKRIVSAGANFYGPGIGELKVWDANTGKELLDLKGHSSDVLAAKFSGDGERIVSSAVDKTVRVWSAETGKALLSLKMPEANTAVAIDRDGKRIVTGGRDQLVRLWDVDTGKELRTLSRLQLGSVAFSPDGKWVIGGVSTGYSETSGWVIVWDIATGQELANYRAHPSFVRSIDVSLNGNRIVSGGCGSFSDLRVWSLSPKR